MGCGYDFACRTCKKSYYLGYGSYGTWHTCDTLEEFDAAPIGSERDLLKNQNIRKCLEEHAGHDHTYIGWDWCSREKGNIVVDGGGYVPDKILIEGWREYERIDLCPD